MPVVGRYGVILSLFIALVMLSGCGGGGASSSESSLGGSTAPAGGIPLAPRILNWQPPTSYTDATPLNPVIDLDHFEIYVHESVSFSDTDTPQAVVRALDPGTQTITTSFNLANLSPLVTVGPRYYVSLRAVAITGLKSDFSPPVSFSF